MRAFRATLFLLVLLLVLVPAPAQAWWGWLDNLSGPGPFNGLEFDFKFLCFMDQPSWQQALTSKAALPTVMDALTIQLNALVASAPAAAAVPTRTAQFSSGQVSLEKLGTDFQTLSTRLKELSRETNIDTPLDFSMQLHTVDEDFQGVSNVVAPPLRNDLVRLQRALHDALRTAAILWRGIRVPSVSSPHLGLWASCSDRLRNETPRMGEPIRHEDRRPVISIVLNYRDLRNSELFHVFSNVARDGGAAIHLRILEPKLSWPMSGRFDFLDGQAGAGIYFFSSDAFRAGAQSFHGLIFEPIRFDVHAPGSLIEHWANRADQPFSSFLRRLSLSVSYSAGVVMFPGGFSADRFISDKPGDVGRAISGGEAIFEQGIVFNVGRIIGL